MQNMEDDASAQVQVEVRMKKSQHFFGNLLRQEFQLEPLPTDKQIWPILLWNNIDLKNERKKLPMWTKGPNGDVAQNLKDLKRNSKYTFFIRVITQFTKRSSLSHQCEYNEMLSTSCNCNQEGSNSIACDNEGKCYCKSNIDGDKCDKCINGFFGFPNCQSKWFLFSIFHAFPH